MDAVSDARLLDGRMLKHRVPLKGGESLETWAVDPLATLPAAEREPWTRRVLGSFTEPSVHVRALQQNTKAFLAHATDHAAKHALVSSVEPIVNAVLTPRDK